MFSLRIKYRERTLWRREGMYMKRKKWIIFMIGAVLFYGSAAKIKAMTEQITTTQLEQPISEADQKMLARRVLDDTGETYDLEDAENVTVYFGDVISQTDEDALVVVDFGKNNTIVAAYTPDGNAYTYVGNVGRFGNISKLSFIPVPALGKNMIVVQDSHNQNIGAYEENELLRGYVYEDDGTFRNVLTTSERIRALWNEIWNQTDIQDESNWKKVEENTELNWLLGASPVLSVERNQTYSEGPDGMAINDNQPEDGEFTEKSERQIISIYRWSDKWGRFILAEATDRQTGEQVAMLEQYSASPYALADAAEAVTRIQRADGTIEDVPDSRLLY